MFGIGHERSGLTIPLLVLGITESKHTLVSMNHMNMFQIPNPLNCRFPPTVSPTRMLKNKDSIVFVLFLTQLHGKLQKDTTLDQFPLSLSLVFFPFADSFHLRKGSTRRTNQNHLRFVLGNLFTTFLSMTFQQKIPTVTNIIRPQTF